jgi:toxin ParE1/3/4
MIKSNYIISTLAEEDLLNIFLISIEGWGIDKAHKYSKTLEEAFIMLSKHPDLGKERKDLFSGALSFPVGSHIIFYRKKDSQIEISRILHQRMDFQRNFV